jgi:hypothetical protein
MDIKVVTPMRLPLKRGPMSVLISLTGAIVLVLVLVGCKSSAD